MGQGENGTKRRLICEQVIKMVERSGNIAAVTKKRKVGEMKSGRGAKGSRTGRQIWQSKVGKKMLQ